MTTQRLHLVFAEGFRVSQDLILGEKGEVGGRIVLEPDCLCGNRAGLAGSTLVQEQHTVVGKRRASPPIQEITHARARTSRTTLQKNQQRLIQASGRHQLPRKNLNLPTSETHSGGIQRHQHPMLVDRH